MTETRENVAQVLYEINRSRWSTPMPDWEYLRENHKDRWLEEADLVLAVVHSEREIRRSIVIELKDDISRSTGYDENDSDHSTGYRAGLRRAVEIVDTSPKRCGARESGGVQCTGVGGHYDPHRINYEELKSNYLT